MLKIITSLGWTNFCTQIFLIRPDGWYNTLWQFICIPYQFNSLLKILVMHCKCSIMMSCIINLYVWHNLRLLKVSSIVCKSLYKSCCDADWHTACRVFHIRYGVPWLKILRALHALFTKVKLVNFRNFRVISNATKCAWTNHIWVLHLFWYIYCLKHFQAFAISSQEFMVYAKKWSAVTAVC